DSGATEERRSYEVEGVRAFHSPGFRTGSHPKGHKNDGISGEIKSRDIPKFWVSELEGKVGITEPSDR
ncbi:hypothetical protein, partial [Moorena sp. SIO1F2]|uniref:hypothetical protein n=1 Tax=Moorena sp. SIO1F2 TaxID=2607819 RepID=UPI0025DAB7C1